MAQEAKRRTTEQSDDRRPPLWLYGEVWRLRGEEIELDGGANEESKQATTVWAVSELSEQRPGERGEGDC